MTTETIVKEGKSYSLNQKFDLNFNAPSNPYLDFTMNKDYNLDFFYCNDKNIDEDMKPNTKPPLVDKLK